MKTKRQAVLTLCTTVAMLCGYGSANANLVTNGGFESGSFSGWTQFGDTSWTFITAIAHSGTHAASLGPVTSIGGIGQTLATIAGDVYAYSFWLANYGVGPNSFSWAVDGVQQWPSFSDAGIFPYTEFTGTFRATAASSLIEFNFFHPPAKYLLDDVVIVDTVPNDAVPEPTTLWLAGAALAAMGVARRRTPRDRAR